MEPEQQERRYQDDESSFAEATSSDKDSSLSFPQQLMEVLSNDRLSDVVSWLPHGQGWIIHDKKRFAAEVLPVYFEKKSKWTSFTRKLNRWNFTRVTRGDEVGAYYHPLFKREDKELCLQMNCLGSKMAQNLEPLNPVALGLATPKMIEHGLLTGMAPKRTSHTATKKKKAAIPSQQHESSAPPSSSSGTFPSSSLYFQSQLTADQITTMPLAPSSSSSAHLQLNPAVHNFPSISVPSTVTMNRQITQDASFVDPQQAFLGTIGNPLTTSAYGGMILPELRNATQSPHPIRPPSPNPLLPFVNATFLQPTPLPSSYPSSSWTQQNTESSLFSNPTPTAPQLSSSFSSSQTSSQQQQQQQQHNQNIASYLEHLNQRLHAASHSQHQQQDTLTLTPTPAMQSSHSVETPSHPSSRSLVEVLQQQHQDQGGRGQAWSPDHSGQDISPSMFDTTSSSSDQGSGVHHHHPLLRKSSSETSNKKLSPESMTTATIVQTPPSLHEQGGHRQQQGSTSSRDQGGRGGSVIGIQPPSVVALHRGQNTMTVVGGSEPSGRPGGGVGPSTLSSSSLSSQQGGAASTGGTNSSHVGGLLESILAQTRKDFHDLLQQQQQTGSGEALTSPATLQSIIRGIQHDASPKEKKKEDE